MRPSGVPCAWFFSLCPSGVGCLWGHVSHHGKDRGAFCGWASSSMSPLLQSLVVVPTPHEENRKLVKSDGCGLCKGKWTGWSWKTLEIHKRCGPELEHRCFTILTKVTDPDIGHPKQKQYRCASWWKTPHYLGHNLSWIGSNTDI